MVHRKRNILLVIAAGVATTLPSMVLATNGYFSHGISIKEKGLVGAGVAYSQDSLAAGTNPAGMVWQGNRWDVGAALFHPEREYTATGFNFPPAFGAFPGTGGSADTVDSEMTDFLIPQFGWNKMLNEQSSFGVSVFGRGGMNTTWKAKDTFTGAGAFGTGDAGVDLAQLFIMPTYSRKYSDKGSWGVSAIVAYQTFKAKGIASLAPFSNDPANLTNNGDDTSTGFGIAVGWQGKVAKNLTLGASYQSEVKMDEFDKYKGLFAEQGDFDIPSQWNLGLAWDVTAKSKLLFDVQQINYTDVPAVSNPSLQSFFTACAGAGGVGTTGCLGGDKGAGFA